MTIKPVGDNVIIKIDVVDGPQTTLSGIIIPSSNNVAKPDKGEVVAVGSGRVLNNGETLKPIVKEGNQIIFNRFAGTEISVDNNTYLLIKEADILAIINE
jgi:chaperonin GroES